MNNYNEIIQSIPHLLEGERNFITNAANFSAIIFDKVQNLNWVGFYIFNGKELVLGPFQGKNACVRIALNRGVCGVAASKLETITVDNVNEFPGHIACDSNSKSEIVLPILKNGELYCLLDVDSPIYSRFGEQEKEFFEKAIKVFLQHTELQDIKDIFK